MPLLKVQVAGPMTLAASMELPNLHKVLTDHGAFRDLAGSLAEGVRLSWHELAGRLPGTGFVLQVDEPSLPQVLAGQVPTPSGYGTVRSLASSRSPKPRWPGCWKWRRPVTGWCTAAPRTCPTQLISDAGADAVSVDAGLIADAHLDGSARWSTTAARCGSGCFPAPTRRSAWTGRRPGAGAVEQARLRSGTARRAGGGDPVLRAGRRVDALRAQGKSVLRELGRSLREQPE